MIRIFFFVVLAGLVAMAGGVLMLGVFPPTPAAAAGGEGGAERQVLHALATGVQMDPKVDAFLEMLTVERGAARNTIASYTLDLATSPNLPPAAGMGAAAADADDLPGLYGVAACARTVGADRGAAAVGAAAVPPVPAEGGCADGRSDQPAGHAPAAAAAAEISVRGGG